MRRAEAHASLGHWAEAADDMETAFRSGFAFSEPTDAAFRRRLATYDPHPDRHDLESLVIYRLASGARQGYRAIGSMLRSWTSRDARPGIAILVVYLLTMGPDGSADPGDTVRLAESAIAALSPEEALGAQRYLGAALYRAGRYAEAVSHLESGRNGRDGTEAPGTGPSWRWHTLDSATTPSPADGSSTSPPGPISAEGPTRSRPSMTSRSTCSAARPRRWSLLDPRFPAEPFGP